MKDIEIVKNTIEEILTEIKAKNCYVAIDKSWVTVYHTCQKEHKVYPITQFKLANTKLIDSNSLIIDLNDPTSIETLRAVIGLDYDIYTNARWEVLLKSVWIFSKAVWRARKPLALEIKEDIKYMPEWLQGRFKKP